MCASESDRGEWSDLNPRIYVAPKYCFISEEVRYHKDMLQWLMLKGAIFEKSGNFWFTNQGG